MTWLGLAILTAFFESLKDVFSKKSLNFLDEYVVASAGMAIAAISLLPVLAFVGIPTLGPNFWMALAIGGSLNVVAYTLYVKAIRLADLSLMSPLSTLTPLFLLITSPLIVQEVPTAWDAVGVFLIVLGSYVLNLNASADGFFGPLRSIFRNKGTRMMVVVAFIWSITSTFDKVGVLNSSPIFWAIVLFGSIALGILPLIILKSKNPIQGIRSHWRLLLAAGVANGIGVGCQMVAVGMVAVTQVIAVKRMSALISVGFGYFVFGEKGIRERLLGSGIMVTGVVVMTIG
ncbi:MAG: EamA family transporter [Cyanobacteria bacterium]|nr:EamA family transporter [Cyanobacteriota bacterium]